MVIVMPPDVGATKCDFCGQSYVVRYSKGPTEEDPRELMEKAYCAECFEKRIGKSFEGMLQVVIDDSASFGVHVRHPNFKDMKLSRRDH